MIKKITIILLLHISLTKCISQTYNLEIEIENIKNGGIIYMAIYNNSQDFNMDNEGDNIKKKRWVTNLVEKINIDGYKKSIVLEKGTYAISLFVDSNGNKKIDKNFIGIPKEQYGFSNNAMGLLGKPSFKNASFILNENTKHKIKLK